MDDPLLVGFLQALGDLGGDAESFVEGKRAFLDLVRQRRPVDIGHRDEGLALFVVNAEDLADVGVV